ncbi:MAG: enoyl-CoA hydratase/isomerase family protein [Gammaproteobacteria bacterium]|nr:enoyl-CoA hydratase/isomerase family protein [Gammaproteobacteria bacterium]MBQ0838501.1 enoyl-CoA hydratase/isomerase family protein [Gammaproteobacteria bacterium]
MSYQAIKFQREGNIARITLARPEAANALNFAMGEELYQVAKICAAEPSIRAVILDAESKIFCAGGDVLTFAEAGDALPATLRQLLDTFHPAVEIFSSMNAPLIASVQGVAAGAGLSLLSSCSFVVASAKASFTMAYTGIGMTPDGSATYYLPRQIGLRRAEELMITNRRLSAAEALEWGLINQCVEPGELTTTVQSLAEKLASGPTLAFGRTRQLLMSSFDNNFSQQLEAEEKAIIAMAKTRDGLGGVAAFKAREKPQFNGE